MVPDAKDRKSGPVGGGRRRGQALSVWGRMPSRVTPLSHQECRGFLGWSGLFRKHPGGGVVSCPVSGCAAG
ncbi:hypothetical protein SCA03_65680 [Streptomyces cacaoi]|uniref:Uncharacterized protein n=1 Tax=Streptomyces cacaoi TaxID=1898 RepID=A0A4Y3RBE1_STRCI|nr:hypothetical protein SCA03_65680 [Streptomyces cacaoi]